MSTNITPKLELTPEELVDLEIPDEVYISPSAEQVVYSVSPMGGKGEHKTSIWIAQVGHEKSAQQLNSGLYDDRIPHWFPDEETLAFLSDRSDRGKSCAIDVLPIRGGEAYPTTKAENEGAISTFVEPRWQVHYLP